eukprot:g5496.t1
MSKGSWKRENTIIKPLMLKGTVVKGFQRGSKELGIPTANLSLEELGDTFPDSETGIYAGWAQVDGKDVHKMVMSVGWNPFYKNTKKTCEPHIMHKFTSDFYGKELRLVVTCYIRPEANFDSLDALIKAIQDDIDFTDKVMDETPHKEHKASSFFKKD